MTNWISRAHFMKTKKSSHKFTLILLGTLSTSCVAFVNTLQQTSKCITIGDDDVTPNLRLIHRESEELTIFTKPIYLATSATATCIQNESTVSHPHSRLMMATGAREHTTKADRYFQENHDIPMPTRAHVSLDSLIEESEKNGQMKNQRASEKILIVGDVHGCLDELKALVTKASTCNNNQRDFKAVILVGDLCNKGPDSSEVIRFVRQQRNWFSVRGNHDNSALAAALGDKKRSSKRSYEWINNLSAEDVDWMSQLPYSITIPKCILNGDTSRASSSLSGHPFSNDVIVVHAGFVPGVALEDQEVQTMTTIREVVKVNNSQSSQHQYGYFEKHQSEGKPLPWAQVWNGPEHVIFGHDAKRGLQNEKYAIGLDTGACYGNKLTGIILPDQKLVSVDSEIINVPLRETTHEL